MRAPTGSEIAATDPASLPADETTLRSHRRRTRRKLSPAELRAASREKQALEHRIAGANFAQIALELGYSTPAGAYKAVERALRRWGMEDADQLRAIEFARMDRITEQLWRQIEKGETEAIALYLKVSERRAKMAGLDAPRRTEVSGPGGSAVQVEKVERALEYQALVAEVVSGPGGRIPGLEHLDAASTHAALDQLGHIEDAELVDVDDDDED